jgi:glutamate-ammonia-ligase adenylyltransferase
LAPDSAAVLTAAYQAYRSAGHRQQLQAQPAKLAGDALAEQRSAVQAVWAELMATETDNYR